MRLSDIVNQLFAIVPRRTNYFTEELTVSSLTSSGTTATLVTTTPHGITGSGCLNISGALTPNPIVALTQVANIASAETQNDHDQTQGFIDSTVNIVNISGATESDYNGSHTLLTVPNRRNLTYQIENDPASPATGSPILLEDLKYGYNGWHTVTVVDANTVTYELSKAQGSPPQGDIKCRIAPRISGIISPERAMDSYTKKDQNKLWAFVVMGDGSASKDRQADNDTITGPGQGMDYRQLTIQPFAIYVFIPAKGEIGARSARDIADELFPIFCSSLLRVKFPSGFSESAYSGAVYSSNNFYAYNGATYVHEYIFETTGYINYADTATADFGVAFRDIDSAYISSFSDEVFMEDKINLDDEPLP